jgi:MFS family permease
MKRRAKRTPRQARRAAGRIRRAIAYVGQRTPWYAPAATPAGRNLRNLYAETSWFGLLNGLAATFVSVFALRLGATTTQVGWLTALPALVSAAWLVPAARIIERQERRLPLILWSGLLQRLGYLAMALMPFVVASGRVEALIVLNTLVTLPSAVINTAITSLLPDLTAPQSRGQVISTRWLILSMLATVAALGGGRLLDLMPVPLNYQVLLGAGALLSLLSLRYLRRIEVPDAVLARRALPRQKGYAWQRLGASLADVRSQRDFVRFTLASFVFYCGLYLPAALWSVIRVRDLGATDTWIGIIAVIVNASTIAGYFLWGKISAKRGERWVLVVTAFGVTAYALVTALVPTIAWMIPTSLLGGLSWSGCNLALFAVMLRVCPDDHRPTYVALYTALMNVTAFVAPLLGAALSDWAGIRVAFVVAGGVRVTGALLLLWLVR